LFSRPIKITTGKRLPTKLKIALIGPLPPPAGGMANQTRQLAGLLHDENIDVQLIQVNPPYRPACMANIRGLRAIFRLLPYLFRLWTASGKVDLFHIMANSGWSWFLFATPAIWIASWHDVPVVVNYRGGKADEFMRQSSRWVLPTMRRSNVLAVPSSYLETVFKKYQIEAQVVPNIIDLERFNMQCQDTDNGNRPFHLIVTRNLEAIYGVPTAIRALKCIKESHPNVKMSIAGSGPQRNELESMIHELGLKQEVTLTGRLGPDDMARLYQSADIMLNPSTVDNMPNSILEALASGVPVVSTHVGGIPDMVRDRETALLIEPENPEAMAQAVLELIENQDQAARLRKNGLQHVKQFSWPEVKRQWLGIYHRLTTTADTQRGIA